MKRALVKLIPMLERQDPLLLRSYIAGALNQNRDTDFLSLSEKLSLGSTGCKDAVANVLAEAAGQDPLKTGPPCPNVI